MRVEEVELEGECLALVARDGQGTVLRASSPEHCELERSELLSFVHDEVLVARQAALRRRLEKDRVEVDAQGAVHRVIGIVRLRNARNDQIGIEVTTIQNQIVETCFVKMERTLTQQVSTISTKLVPQMDSYSHGRLFDMARRRPRMDV